MIKRVLTLLLAATALFSSAFAQFQGGLSIGTNAAQIDGDGARGYNKFGLNVGGFLRSPMDKYQAIQLELLFEQLGSRGQFGYPNFRMNYASVPVLYCITLPVQINGSEPLIDFQFGGSAGYLLGARNVYTDSDISPALHRIDFRALGGLSLRMSEHLKLLFRGGYSIVPFMGIRNYGVASSLVTEGLGPNHNYVTLALRWQLN